MPLYEVAIVSKVSKNGQDAGELERLIMPPKAVVARDEKGAIVAALKDSNIDMDPASVEVKVRLFQ